MKKIWTKKLLLGVFVFSVGAPTGKIFAEISQFKQSAHRLLKMLGFEKQSIVQKNGKKSNTYRIPRKSLNDNQMVKDCYEDYLMTEPDVMEGQVLFHWKLNKQGHVDEIQLVDTEIPNDIFTTCLEEAVIKTKFPVTRQKIGRTIAHRFRFERGLPREIIY